MLYYLCGILALVLAKCVFHLEVKGVENIPRKGGIIIASNHASLLDPIIISAACLLGLRNIEFMAKAELFKNKLFGAFIWNLHAFPVNRKGRDVSAVKEAIKRLKSGKVLLLFPGGRRTKGTDSSSVQSGVGLLAKRANVPILPVFVDGTGRALPKGSWFIRPRKVTVHFGVPYAANGSTSYEEVAVNAMNKIKSLNKEKSKF